MKTKIEWADETWNPVTGCTKVSEGCRNCYAEGIAKRFWGERKFTDVQVHPDRLDAPLHWKKPRRVFVNSMSDLFHPDVPFEFIDKVFGVMTMACEHTFMILTKRPSRMLDWFNWTTHNKTGLWPLPNVWLGVTVENQKAADERVPLLLQTPAARRFVSIEPALENVDLTHVQYDGLVEINALTGDYGVYRPHQGHDYNKLDWAIAGGETGPGARPMELDWARSLRDQCQDTCVPFFFKRVGTANKARGENDRLLDGVEWNEYPNTKN